MFFILTDGCLVLKREGNRLNVGCTNGAQRPAHQAVRYSDYPYSI